MKRIQTRVGLADRLGCDRRTISKWLKEIGVTHRGALKPLDLLLFEQKVSGPLKP